jgi:hypothetical protein
MTVRVAYVSATQVLREIWNWNLELEFGILIDHRRLQQIAADRSTITTSAMTHLLDAAISPFQLSIAHQRNNE